MEVSVLGFGAAEIGYQGVPFERARELLNKALDAGLNVIDTAECYRNSEELIGRAISNRRNEYFLFTKCGHASGFDLPDWDPKMLEQQIDRSLKRLQTETVDLIQLHGCSKDLLEKGDVVRVLEEARSAGKARFIGYSGDGEDAVYAIHSGKFDTLQTSINIADQEAIGVTLPMAHEKQMGVIAKRPIANAAWKTGTRPQDAYHQEYWDRLQKLDYRFLQESLNDSISIALRFTLAAPGVGTAIVGTSNPDRWAANARLLESGALSPEEVEMIRDRWREVAGSDWVGQG